MTNNSNKEDDELINANGSNKEVIELNSLTEIDDSNGSMLTTLDNPYNPFTQFDEWFQFDREKGYNTLNYLARIVVTSTDLTEADQSLAIEKAMDEIVSINLSGRHIKVTEKGFRDRSKDVKRST